MVFRTEFCGGGLNQGGCSSDQSRRGGLARRSSLRQSRHHADRAGTGREGVDLDAGNDGPGRAATAQVNARFGRGALYPAAMGVKRPWATKFERKSPSFTTHWEELPKLAA
ncbi:DUF4113 domain-containing protein [Mesorhizobium australafricanum]|uniref:DUF4113 domain-containing protein n=1 Tax=Mesorhizobium australafricanum TaxID=3072311 RepID=UPI003D31915A